jgi:two-component system C4-dicarboxylate transport sensor histidine kinase DctB
MNLFARLIFEHRRLAWLVFLTGVVLASLLATNIMRDVREAERLSLLETDVSRRALELMSTTLNGNLMGSVSLLGLIDAEIKREALGQLPPNNARISQVLESVGRSYDADGVFVVTTSGVVGTSWDNSGKPSTGLNVKFRPYYQMGMQGLGNVYAAVSLARGDRSLYFSAPVFVDTTNATDTIGVVVARTGLLKVDDLLRDKADAAVLLSPQGVVFASSRPEWIGRLAGTATPERLKAIRELKQFGKMFDSAEPALLPISIEAGVQPFDGRRFAVTRASVQWNDPFGDWTLVLMEDLDRTVPLTQRLGVGSFTAVLLLLLGTMVLKVLQSHHRQALATDELARMSHEQQAQAVHKEQVAAAALLLQYAKSWEELTHTFLGEMHRIFHALQGVVYLVDADHPEQLVRRATYACVEEPASRLAVGEGLLGQCARDHRPLIITDIPAGVGVIHSGLGSTPPAALLIAPVLLKDELLGVVELALLNVPGAADHERLLDMTRLLAMNLEILGRTVAAQTTLEEVVAAERAQAEQLNFQQALIDTIPYPVFYKGPDTRFLGVNKAYERTFNVARADLIGKRVLDLEYLPEADRQSYQAEDEATIAQAGTIERDMKIPFADGTLHDTIYFVAAFRQTSGKPGGLVGTFIDVSAVKQAEQDSARLADAERFNRLTQRREGRILELKHEVNRLAETLGQAPVYESAALQSIQIEAEAFAAEMGNDGPAGVDDLNDPEAIRHLIATLQQERFAALSLAEDAEQARQAMAAANKGDTQ